MQLANKYQKLVDFFGTQSATADALGIRQPSVNAWLSGKAKMSAKLALKAEKITDGKFKAVDLCPDLKDLL